MSFALYIARITAFLIGLFLLEFCASYPLFRDYQGVLDTYAANSYFTERRMVIYNREVLSHAGKKIVLLGASNVIDALRPNELAPFFPGVKVYNMGLSGSQVKETGEEIKLILDAVPPEYHKDLTFVLGVWYGSFEDNALARTATARTELTKEMLNSGLYRENGTHMPTPRFSKEIMRYAKLATYPFMMTSAGYNRIMGQVVPLYNKAKDFIFPRQDNIVIVNPEARADANTSSAEYRDWAMNHWNEEMGPVQDWNNNSFNQLFAIVKSVSSTGAKFILIDMPLPSWHRERSPYDRIYQERLHSYVEQMSSIPGFSYGDMRQNFNDSDDFQDSTHPRPKATRHWADRAAQLILPELAK